jgi:hypothetical protein
MTTKRELAGEEDVKKDPAPENFWRSALWVRRCNSIEKRRASQQIRQRLLNGYPPESAFCELMAHISDAELLRQERAAHLEKVNACKSTFAVRAVLVC